jgi:serine/threonine protein kinase
MSIKCPEFLNSVSEIKGYTCVKYLGQGAFGVTFLMKDEYKEKVAVKIIPLKEKTELETSILKKLTSSCSKKRILCYHKSFDTKTTHYIVTEYIDGAPLNAYTFTDKKVVYKFIGQLIDAVEYIHSLGVVHFDIKPGNIMVTASEDLKLIDFGGAGTPDKDKPYSFETKTKMYSPPQVEWTVKNFKYATYFDWYTVITTIKYIISGGNFKDLEPFVNKIPYNSKIMKVIQNIKKVVVKHIGDTVDKKSIDNFLKPEYKSDVRKMFEEMKISKKKCPPGKILNPKTNRCVNIDGKIGKTLV